ncbi:MAG: hypothetical protein JSW51_00730, partial [Gemmatimonadota bacterium]
HLDYVGGSGRRVTEGENRIRIYMGGGVRWSCQRDVGTGDSIRIWSGASDSLARYLDTGRADFVGNAFFRDSTIELTADRATYFEPEDRLVADGNVRLVNLVTGSVLTGPTLTYWRAVAGVRDTASLYAPRRPRVEYKSTGDPEVEPYIIRADHVRLTGNDIAHAGGTVTIDRSDFTAKGDSTELDMSVGEGFLIGHAEAGGTDSVSYNLRGRRIAFRLEENQLNWVQAQGRADATSAGWRMVGDTIELHLAEEKLQAAQMWGDSTRPRAMSETYTIVSDSMAVDVPNQVLTEVRAFGTAKATAKPDSLSTEADWMAGDTVTVRFDSTEAGERTLSELIAAGNAQAYYRIYDEEDSTAAPAINYSRGQKIVALFKDEEVDKVQVIGAADGVYLEPKKKPIP